MDCAWSKHNQGPHLFSSTIDKRLQWGHETSVWEEPYPSHPALKYAGYYVCQLRCRLECVDALWIAVSRNVAQLFAHTFPSTFERCGAARPRQTQEKLIKVTFPCLCLKRAFLAFDFDALYIQRNIQSKCCCRHDKCRRSFQSRGCHSLARRIAVTISPNRYQIDQAAPEMPLVCSRCDAE